VYSGMTLKWDYKHRTCDISMPGYVSNVLSKFQHDAPKHPQHTPSRYVTPVYGAKTQYATKDETPPLTAQQCLTIQKSHRIRFVLRPSSGSDRFNATKCHCHRTNQGDGKDAGRHESNVGLLSNPPRRHNPIPRLRYGIARPQRCLLPLGLQRTEPSRRSVFPGQQSPRARNT
jgi:hypothetical protein